MDKIRVYYDKNTKSYREKIQRGIYGIKQPLVASVSISRHDSKNIIKEIILYVNFAENTDECLKLISRTTVLNMEKLAKFNEPIFHNFLTGINSNVLGPMMIDIIKEFAQIRQCDNSIAYIDTITEAMLQSGGVTIDTSHLI